MKENFFKAKIHVYDDKKNNIPLEYCWWEDGEENGKLNVCYFEVFGTIFKMLRKSIVQ